MIEALSSNKSPFALRKPSFSFRFNISTIFSRKRWSSWKRSSQKSGVESILSDSESLTKSSTLSLSKPLNQIQFPSLILAFLGFVLIAFLVFVEDAPSFLLTFDKWIHQWVLNHISPVLRSTLFQVWISDFFIELDLLVGSILLFGIFLRDWRKGLGAVGVSLMGIIGGTGTHHFEGTILHSVKTYFHRSRPQSGMYSYSFPSGHVLATVFLTRLVFYQLLPLFLDQERSKKRRSRFLYWMQDHKEMIVGASFIMTMIGRVGGNVHWFSDTLGSLFLGTAFSLLVDIPFSYIKFPNQQKSQQKM